MNVCVLTQETNKKSFKSAIENLSVPDVRKALAHIRKKWNALDDDECFFSFVEDCGVGDMTVQEFGLKFVYGQNIKRVKK
jgi:hypothetical protein